MAAKDDEIVEEAPKKQVNVLLIAVIGMFVLLIAVIGILVFVLLKEPAAPSASEGDATEQVEPYKPEDKAVSYSPSYKQFPAPQPGTPAEYFDLDQMVVGFRGEGKAKHLAVKVKMKTNYVEVVQELEHIKPDLINDISAMLRKKTYTEMNEDDAQDLLADEILRIARAALENEKVYPDLLDRVLIERFVMQ